MVTFEEIVKNHKRYLVLRDGQTWPATFESWHDVEPLRGEELDASLDKLIGKQCNPTRNEK